MILQNNEEYLVFVIMLMKNDNKSETVIENGPISKREFY